MKDMDAKYQGPVSTRELSAEYSSDTKGFDQDVSAETDLKLSFYDIRFVFITILFRS